MLKQKPNEEKNISYFQNKFGAIEVNFKYKIFFPKGLIGLSDFKNFCLCKLPDKKHNNFRLLQSIDNEQLCFLTLLISVDDKLIKRQNLDNALKNLGLNKDHASILLICSTKRTDEKSKIVVKLRAPIFIDTSDNKAFQYILHNSELSHTL